VASVGPGNTTDPLMKRGATQVSRWPGESWLGWVCLPGDRPGRPPLPVPRARRTPRTRLPPLPVEVEVDEPQSDAEAVEGLCASRSGSLTIRH
jgi:hypothetical protein